MIFINFNRTCCILNSSFILFEVQIALSSITVKHCNHISFFPIHTKRFGIRLNRFIELPKLEMSISFVLDYINLD